MSKDLVIGIVAILALIVGITSFAISQKSVTAVKGDQGIQGIVGEQGLRGYQGLQGLQGIAGIVGKDGVNGKDGINGKDAVVNLDTLTTQVANLLEDRENQPEFSTSGAAGNFSAKFKVDSTEQYDITLEHFGSGDFEVSLVDWNDNVDVLIDSQGHLKTTKPRNLTENKEYTLRVSAAGDWKVVIEK